MKNIVILLVVVAVLAAGGFYYMSQQNAGSQDLAKSDAATTEQGTQAVVTAGNYAVIAEESELQWAAQKPLIPGYVNSGTIDFKDGSIVVTDASATGMFNFDMNTLRVGLTAKKPGMESKLEEHLKKSDFFDVAKYPDASFVITSVAPVDASAFTYTIIGKLTMKGVTGEVTFPAKIYKAADGKLRAEAAFAIDRTKWNITFGSKNFVDKVTDNVIDDMVELKLSVVAESK